MAPGIYMLSLSVRLTVISCAIWAALSVARASSSGGPLSNEVSFLWGVANSSFQVEGAPAKSDWLRFTRKEGTIADGTNADRASDFWNRYDEDFALAQELGVKAFRFSIAWERIEPKEGEWDLEALDHYKKMITALRARGIEPIVTLYHWTNPIWVKQRGGVEWSGFPRAIARYAEFIIRELTAAPYSVNWWITLNEPEVQALAGYMEGVFPPGRKHDVKGLQRALENLAIAHIKIMTRVREAGLPGKYSVAKNWQAMAPYDRGNPFYVALQDLAYDFYNKQFLRAIQTGEIRFEIPVVMNANDIQVEIPKGGTLDYLGINYYSRSMIKLIGRAPYFDLFGGPGPKTEMGWEIYPKGIGEAVRDAYEHHKLPIMITENGISDGQDAVRPGFMVEHIAELLRAREDGIPILGYMHWSLTDNFEWASGLSRKFGLVEIDYETLKRTPRPSFYLYKDLIESSGI